MYELISALSGLKDVQIIARDLAFHTLQTFHFDHIELRIEQKEEQAYIVSIPEGQPNQDLHSEVWPLETVRGQEGQMQIWYSRPPLLIQENQLLQAFLSQGALALERVRLAKGENMVRILEESDQLKSSLLNSVSHELRTPLSVIKASVSSLRSGTVQWNDEARQDLLATIEEETDELNLLVGNLLDMSRIESNALKPQKRWNAIDEIAMGVVAKMRKQLAQHHLEMNFEKDLPLVPTDFVMIGQVFLNLINNSIKYSPENSTISVSVYKENESIHFEIANEGPPVPEEHLERIFDKFYRVTEAERITGTGLGLSICKGIVEAHGGNIWAVNETGRFVFHFILPLTLDGSLPQIPQEELDE
jgi:two-component system sensor histidine kinase KdpD